MSLSLRGSRKGDLLQRQAQVIYSIPKFAIYFPPPQPLALTRFIQTIAALCCYAVSLTIRKKKDLDIHIKVLVPWNGSVAYVHIQEDVFN